LTSSLQFRNSSSLVSHQKCSKKTAQRRPRGTELHSQNVCETNMSSHKLVWISDIFNPNLL